MAISKEYGGPRFQSPSIAIILEDLGWGCARIETIAKLPTLIF